MRSVEGSESSHRGRAASGEAAEALHFSHYSMLSVMEFGTFLGWLNERRTEEPLDREKQVGSRVVG
jgi:hypothetical protein